MSFPRSGTVDTQTYSGTKDFVLAHSSALQNSNIAANDHFKLDTVDFQRGGATSASAGAASGGSITLDTTTTYSNTVGAASLGRFTLQGGKVYRLEFSPGYVLFSGATGVLTYQWFDVTSGSGTAISQPQNVYTVTDAGHEAGMGDSIAIYAPGGSSQDRFLVEVQITAVTALTSIGNTAKGLPTAFVETI